MKRIAVLLAGLLTAALAYATTVNIPLTVTVTPTQVSIVIGGQTTVIPVPQVTPPTPPPPISGLGLHVAANKILNAAGTAVAFRGVDRSGTEYMCVGSTSVFDGPADAASVAALGTWAINIVRLPINEDCWLGINGVITGGAAYQAAIVAYVNLLSAANIATIIDLQWTAPGTTIANQLTPMPDADHSLAFWTSAATKFKSNASVIFDLFNEPYPDSNQDTTAAWTCLRDGGACPGVSYPAVGTQALVNAIRATGATNVIMVPGVQFTNSLTRWNAFKPVDPLNQLAASWHSYADQICNSQACWTANVQPVLASVPLIAGEIGERDCQGIYIDPLMAWLDAQGGNYLAWAWDTYDCSSFPALISDYTGTPTGFGIDYRNHLLTLAGKTPPAPPVIPFFSSIYPFGIAVGKTGGANYTASDGTVYYNDVSSTGFVSQTTNPMGFAPFTSTDTITGTADPVLYQTGRQGCCATWTINVPNGAYTVTLGMAPNSAFNQGEFGQDQNIQGQKVGTCVWSPHSGTNLAPSGGVCPQAPMPIPALDAATTVSYPVQVFNQQLVIEPAASFGGGRTTILNTIKVAQAGVVVIPPVIPPVSPPPVTPPSAGTWVNVTPANADLTSNLSCNNYGTQSVQADASNPGTLYTEFNCQGVWKSKDYGLTWAGPINTGANGAAVGDCAGAITLAPNATVGGPATLYEACIRGAGTGFWKSIDGGVNWAKLALSPLPSNRQDVYAPVVDPYDVNHLLMCGHEQNVLLESKDGGQTWNAVPMNAGMLENGGTGGIFFINTGSAATTRLTWLWMAQQSGGVYGTWRTTNAGASWVQVDKNEHPHGASQIYQPDTAGVLYMAGAYSSFGWGVLRSTNYGQTWSHVGGTGNEGVVFGTPKVVYALVASPAQGNAGQNPSLESAAQPGTGAWSNPGTPAGMSNGPGFVAVVNNGANNILVGANWGAGLWRYVEP